MSGLHTQVKSSKDYRGQTHINIPYCILCISKFSERMRTLLFHLFLFFIVARVTILIPVVVHGRCIESQKQSLLNFKKTLAFDSSSSSKLTTWNSSIECCSWLGVTCVANGSVVGLDISMEGVSCNIDSSSSLFQLEHLQSLNLAYNDFKGSSIPSAIGKLANLRYLNLTEASYSGQVLIEVARLTRLTVLDLSYNYPIGEFELKNPNLGMLIQNLPELTELHLDGLNLSSEGHLWSQTISSSLPKLRVLTLSNCDLTGPIHESFTRLRSLSVLTLDGNNIAAPVPTFFVNLSSLVSLSLRDCNLRGIFPKEIFHMPTLQSVDLSSNSELQGSLPEFPKNLSLESLILSMTKFSGDFPFSIGNLEKLSELYLNDCNFTGAIPKSLANMTRLEHLYLSSNNFHGPISSVEWNKLIKLQDLILADNLLYGSIPASLFSVPLLQWIQLSGNNFSGQLLEFSNVSSYLLYELDFSSNSLEGSIPISIFNLPGLEVIDLSSNNFSDFPFNGLHWSKNLSSLDLSHNSLLLNENDNKSSHPSFLQITNLNLASNKLKKFPIFLKDQSTLDYLDLSANQISGQIPIWIWSLPLSTLNLYSNKLEGLESPLNGSTTYLVLNIDLHSNQLQGQIPLFITGNYLDYSRNNFSSSIPSDIGDFISSTAYLSLSSNNLHGEIPTSICNATGLVLDLSNNSLSGAIPQCLTQMPFSLSVLDLRRNNLIGSIPDTFLEGCALKTLALSRNQISGQFPKSLANCSSLEVLDLGLNHMTDMFPCSLKTLSTLRVLMLRSNKLYGPIGCPETNGTWPELQIIDLAHNSFNGDIPASSITTWQPMMVNEEKDPSGLGFSFIIGGRIGHFTDYVDAVTTTSKGQEMDIAKILTIYTLIDFSANKFNGAIPKEIGQLRSLYALNLSGNSFTGEIPSSFGNMKSLESLDLSRNNLSGHIPLQLTNLSFLSYLNVSNNQLTGRIPTSTQFSTFPNTAFQGNKGLWGPPLTVDVPAVLPPPTLDASSSSQNIGGEIDWDIISAEIGFICGFGIVVGSLLLCKRWREWYYGTMFNILLKIFPQLAPRLGKFQRHVYIYGRYRR